MPAARTTILLVRHGAFDGMDRRLSGRIPGPGLNAEGERQMRRLAERLAALPIAAIYSSPLQRALDSAALLANALSLGVREAQELREVNFGRWTDRAIDELADDEAWRAYHAQRATARIPEGELLAEVQARALAGLARIAAQHAGERVVAVTHAELIRTLVVACLGCGLDATLRLAIAPASITELALGAQPLVVRVNDAAHEDAAQNAGASGVSDSASRC
jgi:broad specificity phosphatase PhoE